MNRSRLFALTFLAILLMGILPIQSNAIGPWPKPNDFPMNFDSFTTGVASPYPFKLISHGGGSGGNIRGVVFSGWSTPPNLYDLFTGTARQNASLQATFNATEYKVFVTLQTNCISGYTSGLLIQLNVTSNQMSNSSSQASGTGTCTGPGSSKQLNATVTATPGTTVQMNVNWSSTSSSSSGFSSHIYLDNFQIMYGSVIVPNYNFAMYNTSSAAPSWFDPSLYNGSALLLQYSNGVINNSQQWPNAYPLGLVFPDVKYSSFTYPNVKLITMYIGSLYSRSLIPSPSGKLNMYIDNPNSVYDFKISIVGPIGSYPNGSMIFIQQSGHNITSGYLDSSSTFSAALVPGLYTVKVISTTGQTLVSPTSFSSTNTSPTINAYSSSVTNSAGVATSVSWSAGWNSSLTGIIFNYNDVTNTTTQIGIQILSTNSSGIFQQYSSFQTPTQCLGPNCVEMFQLIIPANSPGFNKTTELVVYVNVTNFLGNQYQLGSQQISCQSCIGSLNLPTSPFGLSILGGLNAISMLSYAIIVLTAVAVGNYFAGFGFLAISFEVAFFAFFGWLPASLLSIGIVFVALAVVGLMIWHEGKGIFHT